MSEQTGARPLTEWIRYVQTQAEVVTDDATESGDVPSGGRSSEAGLSQSGATKPRQTRRRQRPETRAQLLERLVNPQISLHEASVLLKVCPATVRGYTRSGRLPDIRTTGGQRRFRFRDVMLLARELDHKK